MVIIASDFLPLISLNVGRRGIIVFSFAILIVKTEFYGSNNLLLANVYSVL